MNNDFFRHDWGDLPLIFTSDKVTSENHWENYIASDQKSLFTVTNYHFNSYAIFYVLNTQYR